MSRSEEQSVHTAASRRPSQTNVVTSAEVQTTVAASHFDANTDTADCEPEIDNTLDAIKQLRQDMRIEMSVETAKNVSEMGKTMRLEIAKDVSEMGKTMHLEIAKDVSEIGKTMRLEIAKDVSEMGNTMRLEMAKDVSEIDKTMRLEIAKDVSEMGKTMRLEIAKDVSEMGKTMRLEIAKDVSEMGKTMRLEIAKDVSEMGKTMRQEITNMFTAMLPKASNWNGEVTTSSRHQETRTSALLRQKRKRLPEINHEPTHTGIIGSVDALVSFKHCFSHHLRHRCQIQQGIRCDHFCLSRYHHLLQHSFSIC